MVVIIGDQIILSKEIEAKLHWSESQNQVSVVEKQDFSSKFSVSTCPIRYPSSVLFAGDVRLRKLLLLYFHNVVTAAQVLDTQTI